ncbi:hypothetical protein QR680_006794 [Steinernema hermaphroditum]|uniref:Uncharacterized protein n=1 Tax=Steinernema hermaphroditum TaxID=289476 RepID=A0AA39HWK7_9BILA|nr:hypothetical protein QR680_006794 [Steinernema hermaphroditum]
MVVEDIRAMEVLKKTTKYGAEWVNALLEQTADKNDLSAMPLSQNCSQALRPSLVLDLPPAELSRLNSHSTTNGAYNQQAEYNKCRAFNVICVRTIVKGGNNGVPSLSA